MLIAFHKPFGVLSQFTSDGSPNRTLAEFGFPKHVYPIGRLDADSEGLLLLSDEPKLNEQLLHPRHAHEREYWVQVERIPSPAALQRLSQGVTIQGHRTLPCRAWQLDPQPEVTTEGTVAEQPTQSAGLRPEGLQSAPKFTPDPGSALYSVKEKAPSRSVTLAPRNPPIRFRKSVPDCWIGLELVEGKNRQVRRMTAAIGHPTLRLLRMRIGRLTLGNLAPGEWKALSPAECDLALDRP